MEKAFYKVWKKGLVLQLMQAEVDRKISQPNDRESEPSRKRKQASRLQGWRPSGWGSLPHTFPGLHEQHPEYHQASCESRTLCR